MIRIEMEVEVTNFLMDQKFKLVMEPDKINGCLGRLLKRLETQIKRRNVSKIKVQMRKFFSLCLRSPFASNRGQLGGKIYA